MRRQLFAPRRVTRRVTRQHSRRLAVSRVWRSANGAPRRTTRQHSRQLAVVVVVAGAVGLSSGCSSSGGISASALQRSVGTAYQRLYLLQQQELGHAVVTQPDSAAQCVRSGSTAHSGSGSWTCTVHYPYADGHIVPLIFDVDVQPIGCYVASGPPAIVGQLELTSPRGSNLTNPLFAFDGCFDAG
jgi:ABC-2 type transport system permease protein